MQIQLIYKKYKRKRFRQIIIISEALWNLKKKQFHLIKVILRNLKNKRDSINQDLNRKN
jgi:hypothetical protein